MSWFSLNCLFGPKKKIAYDSNKNYITIEFLTKELKAKKEIAIQKLN